MTFFEILRGMCNFAVSFRNTMNRNTTFSAPLTISDVFGNIRYENRGGYKWLNTNIIYNSIVFLSSFSALLCEQQGGDGCAME